jgi:hypothetical protein
MDGNQQGKNELDFLNERSDWHCVMCGIDLKGAIFKQIDILEATPDDLVSGKFDRRKQQYVWERTQERGRLTCSRACGYAYKAWKYNLDAKSSYLVAPFVCDKCGKEADGGRLLKNGKRDYKMCRACHRKYANVILRKAWEVVHAEHRKEYIKAYKQRKYVATNNT